ncbi:MAG: class I SAM-dependent methyltransferase [Ginsengibacter sp.]
MNTNITIAELLGQTDIYLIDQIMKDRYIATDKILDAGCGGGRNLHWFIQNGVEILGIDASEEAILHLKNKYAHLPKETFQLANVEGLPFENNTFDHVISSAVLHFATSVANFKAMMSEMIRVLKPNGTLFIRMTSDIGIEDKVELLFDGNYKIPDGSMRFLLTRSLLADCMREFNLSFAEPLKTVNVDDVRCMSMLLLQKK